MMIATCSVPISDRIREILRAKLEAKETTQVEIARIAGTNQPSISRFLQGKHGLHTPALDRIAAHFNLTVIEDDGAE